MFYSVIYVIRISDCFKLFTYLRKLRIVKLINIISLFIWILPFIFVLTRLFKQWIVVFFTFNLISYKLIVLWLFLH